MKKVFFALTLLAWCVPIPARSQAVSEEEEMKGGLVEGRWYFDSSGATAYGTAYFQSYFWISGREKVGWFAFARANNDWAPHSALVAGLSYAPIPYIGVELGAGINGNPLENFYYLRGRLWLGNDLTALAGSRNFYYLDCVVDAGPNQIYWWEARLKIRVARWLGCGVYAEDGKGAGPRIDLQPIAMPISVSAMVLIGRWDSNRSFEPRDMMAAISVRAIF